MAKKEVKTNAMRILDRMKIPYTHQAYECDEFVDGIQTADNLGLPHEKVYKTLVTQGNDKQYYVFVLPIEAELDLKKAAKAAGAELLCETTLEDVLAHMSEIENDRAILRAIHFFKENERVERAAKAVEEKDGETVLKLLSESGKSSWELLQNCYPIKAYTEQKISVALALTDLFLEKLGKGICRIHGGGFAGVIMCVVPEEETENYVSYISEFAGKENVYPMNIRAVGAVHIEK